MKHFPYITIATALLLAMTAVSCSDDFLDKTPEGEYVEDNFYDSDEAMYASTAPLRSTTVPGSTITPAACCCSEA